MKREPIKVQVLHKLETDPRTGEILKTPDSAGILSENLAVGKTFRFSGSGDRYTVQASGAVVNADPKPYRNKAERKKFLAARRAARAI